MKENTEYTSQHGRTVNKMDDNVDIQEKSDINDDIALQRYLTAIEESKKRNAARIQKQLEKKVI